MSHHRSHSRAQPAMVEDADEADNVIDGSYQYARSNVASTPGSPTKQKMNTGRKKSKRPEPVSPTYSESDSTEQASSTRSRKKENRISLRGGKSKAKEPVVVERPTPSRHKTTPSRIPDDPAYYGQLERPPHTTISRPGPFSARPQSYYSGQPTRPPLSNSAYYPVGPMQSNPTSYPPPQWAGPSPLGSSPLGTSPGAFGGGYFDKPNERLAARFQQPDSRPRSAMGMQPGSYGHDDYDHGHLDKVVVARRPSLSKRSAKERDDRRKMPPPERPKTSAPARTAFKPPPPPLRPRKSVGFDDRDFEFDSDDQEISGGHRTSVDFTKALPIRSARRQSVSLVHNASHYAVEPASKSRHENRRSVSYDLENKVKHAAQYQKDVNGGATAHLTTENLRNLKNGGSSRSTRSSASRDASSFRQSATTRTTRSGSGDDDITIKVPSGAIVEVENTKINCHQGGSMTISRGGRGSDRGTLYDEDVRSRAPRTERPSTRTRSSSQSVYSRALPPPISQPRYAPPYPYPMEQASYDNPTYAPFGSYHETYDDSNNYF